MKLSDFFKEYYARTDRKFSDHTVLTRTDRKYAQYRGKLITSKTERRVFIALQYAFLLICTVLACLFNEPLCFGGAGITLFLLLSISTDFSLLKVITVYCTFNNGTAYGNALHKVFTGDFEPFTDTLTRELKPYVRGFIRLDRRYLRVKYSAICRSREDSVTLSFHPRRVTASVNGRRYVIAEDYPSPDALLHAISDVIRKGLT